MSNDNVNVGLSPIEELRQEVMSQGITSRLKILILSCTPTERRFPILEELTGVKEATWRTWWRRSSLPNGALIEGLARAWPEYAFWLVTGLTDVRYGHRMPRPHASILGYVENFPEGSISVTPFPWTMLDPEDEWPSEVRTFFKYTSEYFKVARQMQDEPMESETQEILRNSLSFIREKRNEALSKVIEQGFDVKEDFPKEDLY
ncbi:MAG: hypothetical protein ACTJHW_07935 [Paenalcaligenes sp.]